MDRRTFLKASMIPGIAATPGCAWLRGYLCGDSFDPDQFVNDCGPGFVPIFDAHGHFFNASDLQAGGFLGGPVLNEFTHYVGDDYPEVTRLLQYLGKLVQQFGNNVAISARHELRDLNNLYPVPGSTEKLLTESDIDELIAQDHQEASKRFYGELNQSQRRELDAHFQAAISENKSKNPRSFESPEQKAINLEKLASRQFNEDTLYHAFVITNPQQQKLNGIDPMVSLDFGGIVYRLIAFVGRMLTRRSISLEEYRRTYSPITDKTVVRTADVLVDFDYWLGNSELSSSLTDQVKLHTEINQLTNGYNVPLLGFNPWKAIEEAEDYIKFVQNVLDAGVFRGIKIYPTLGYGPDGEMVDTAVSICASNEISNPDAKNCVQEALFSIYDTCMKGGHVVMAHSNHSSGVSKEAIAIAGPDNWRNVLSNYKNLKVNLGHFGSLDAVNGENWTREFLGMMSDGAYPNVHGDIGYWYREGDLEDFVQLLSEYKKVNPSIVEKVMYGSDWFMISKEAGWGGYLNRTYDAFAPHPGNSESDITQNDINRIFFGNAATFFDAIPENCKDVGMDAVRYAPS